MWPKDARSHWSNYLLRRYKETTPSGFVVAGIKNREEMESLVR
jgi:hypothetical protein